MKRIDNYDEIKKIEFNILKYIKKICEENNLRYFLCGGTLLGAVRHKGFIPWDDDIDLYMPRPDYEKFLKIMKKNNNEYKILTYENKGYYYNFAKVIDSKTKLIENNVKLIENLGVYVDIFPLEGMPSNEKEIKNRYLNLNKLRNKIFDFEFKFPGIRKNLIILLKRYISYFGCKFRKLDECQKRYNLAALEYSYDTSDYVFVTGGRYKMKDIFPKTFFGNGTDLIFEDEIFKVPECYDKILKQLYGEYMKLPPIKQQVHAHEFTAYTID